MYIDLYIYYESQRKAWACSLGGADSANGKIRASTWPILREVVNLGLRFLML